MKVKDLIRELLTFNLEAETNVVAHCKSYNYSLSCGGGDGCTKENCKDVSFYVDELCTNENQEFHPEIIKRLIKLGEENKRFGFIFKE